MMSRSGLPAVLIVALAAQAAPGAAFLQASPRTVALVDGAPIREDAVVAQAMRYGGKTALEQLIDQAALELRAAEKKVTVSEAETKAEFDQLRAATPNFEQSLTRLGVTEAILLAQSRTTALAKKLSTTLWPVTDSDLVRIRLRYARLQDERQAKELIREAKGSASFELLVLQRSIDKENGGLVGNGPILRIDNPPLFRVAIDSNLRPGQVSPQPVRSGEFWLVLKLEERLEPSGLSAQERAELTRRVHAYRLSFLSSRLRQRYKPEYVIPFARLLSDPPTNLDTDVAKVGATRINYRDLLARCLEVSGGRALDQLAERAIIRAEAGRLNRTVSDTEVDQKLADVRKRVGSSTFQTSLDQEGITETAFRERLYYSALAEKVVAARFPPADADLVRYSARYVRVATRQEAAALLDAAKNGAPFEQIQMQRSLDRGGDGVVKPVKFLKVDSPNFHKAITEGGVKPGEIIPQPIQVGRAFYLLKVTERFGPETLTPAERQDAAKRINAGQFDRLLDQIRSEHKIEQKLAISALIPAPSRKP